MSTSIAPSPSPSSCSLSRWLSSKGSLCSVRWKAADSPDCLARFSKAAIAPEVSSDSAISAALFPKTSSTLLNDVCLILLTSPPAFSYSLQASKNIFASSCNIGAILTSPDNALSANLVKFTLTLLTSPSTAPSALKSITIALTKRVCWLFSALGADAGCIRPRDIRVSNVFLYNNLLTKNDIPRVLLPSLLAHWAIAVNSSFVNPIFVSTASLGTF